MDHSICMDYTKYVLDILPEFLIITKP